MFKGRQYYFKNTVKVYDKGGDHRKEISGGVKSSTNNRMEMLAAIAALSALKKPTRATIYSDSQYLVNGSIWLLKWASNNWKTSDGKPVKNQDLWQAIQKLMDKHTVQMKWVRGHNGHPENERCDELAGLAAKGDNLKTDRGYSM